ncbi:hypothetical protein HGO38_01020 [Rhizobium sp. CG5]|uniref:hypothetical protein n=1 Tax=Rhizobium sp. CG5 TaxID=2726076 RepID=UPI0020344A72|nr:hypothetical protein [Rhizobium sp. CG5]MCM2472062.1 hypothetical protein [Rhizobium sp. CG5]
MKKAIAILLVAMVSVPAAVAGVSMSDRATSGASYTNVALAKTDRVVPLISQDLPEETVSEWVLDCYDTFGPEGGNPNENDLSQCLTTAG